MAGNFTISFHFPQFAALAMKANGSVQYALVLDNNFDPDYFSAGTEENND